MTLQNYLGLVCNIFTENGKYYDRNFESGDQRSYFYVPRVYCKDGFNISIQVNCGSYCSSENGYRTYGKEWIRAAWGYPSVLDSLLIDSAENPETRDTIGSLEVYILQQVIDNHGGIDWNITINPTTN